MKIRSDFVTNSSSSCFCVSLSLSFNNGEKLACGNMDSIGEEYLDCANEPGDDVQSSCDGVTFSRIVESRENISELKKILSSCFPKSRLSALKGATELTDARLSVSGCASGEESWRITMYRMLGVEDVSFSDDSIGNNVASLRDAGMTAYEKKGLEQIVLFEDMGQGGTFKDEAAKYGVTYDEYDLSKTVQCSMNKNGKIRVRIYPGESYEKGRPMSGTEWDEIGALTKIRRFEMSVGKVSKAEKAIKKWLKEKNCLCGINQEDNLVSMFKKFGFKYKFEIDSDDSAFILDTHEVDCKKLSIPLADLLQVISPFCDGALIIADTENMCNPMAVKMTSVTSFSEDDVNVYVETEIYEATDEDFEEGYPW